MRNFLSKNLRFSITLCLLLTSFLLLITIVSLEGKNRLFYIIGTSVSSTGISTTLVQIILLATEKAEGFTIQTRLLKVFGYNKNSIADGTIAIIIPAFNVGYSPLNQPSNKLKQDAGKILSRASTKAGIKNDVTAASHIMLAFSQVGLPIPQIRWDEEQNLNDRKIKTYILIGLSNELLGSIQNPHSKYFKVIPESDNNDNLAKISIYLGSFNNGRLLQEHRWTPDVVNLNSETGEPTDGIDIGLFAKFEMDNRCFVVCGAGTETGTHEIAKYISGSGWSQVCAELEKEKGTSISPTEGFAVTFQIPTSRREEISIVRKCIKKNT
jgi:hypothetical protein